MPFPFLGETKTLDDVTRSHLPGDFIRLSDGVTHYEIGGPEAGPSVVLVHGFSVPSFVWEPTFDRLVDTGYRVLRYDLYGRGYSDRPKLKYNLELFTRQLKELIVALELSNPLNLIGLSMGALIALSFADQYRRKVAKLILISPAGFPVPLTWPARLVRLPGIGELLFGLLGQGPMLKAMAKDMYDPNLVEHFLERFKPQMKFIGFKRALLSTMRRGMLGDYSELYRRVGKKAPLVMLVWGRNDQTIPFAHSQYVVDAIPGIHFFPVADAGHIAHYEQPELVNNRIVGFLST
jgi:pimeloyl-ACP methyl ester carboxylesterase